jgi:hypothetical protein
VIDVIEQRSRMTFVVIDKEDDALRAYARGGGPPVFGEPVTSYLLYNGSASSSV